MLTIKQHELLNLIQVRLDKSGVSSSFEEMKETHDLRSKSGVHRLISALEERGYIRRLPNRAPALELLRKADDTGVAAPISTTQMIGAAASPFRVRQEPANDVVELPLHGRIAAGAPTEAIEDRISLSVPSALLGPGEHYALEVSGDSMIEAGIFDGDYAFVRRTNTARDDEIVVALVNDEEATLKYLRRDKEQIRLEPANSAYDPQIYQAHQVKVQGKLAGLLRRYH